MHTILNLAVRGFRRIFTLPILIYRHLISPLLPGACIYYPTCSSYSTESIMRHGVIKGLILGITRIFRCAGGLFTGGEDPVPERFSFGEIGAKYKEFWAHGKKTKSESSQENEHTHEGRIVEKGGE